MCRPLSPLGHQSLPLTRADDFSRGSAVRKSVASGLPSAFNAGIESSARVCFPAYRLPRLRPRRAVLANSSTCLRNHSASPPRQGKAARLVEKYRSTLFPLTKALSTLKADVTPVRRFNRCWRESTAVEKSLARGFWAWRLNPTTDRRSMRRIRFIFSVCGCPTR